MTKQTASAIRSPITFERSYEASIEDLWELWTTKEGFQSWWGPVGFRVEVRTLDLRVGGELRFEIIASAPEQIESMKRAGRPPSHETRGTFVEIAPYKRLKLRFSIDFIREIEPYDYHVAVEFFPEGDHVRMVSTVDRHHDEEWTRLAAQAWEEQLDVKIPAALLQSGSRRT